MSDCQTCAFKRERPNWVIGSVTKYYFGIKHWFFAHESLEVVEDGTKPICYAVPEPVEIRKRTDEKCAYYKDIES